MGLLPVAGAAAGWVIGHAMAGRNLRHCASAFLPMLLALAAGQLLGGDPWPAAAAALLAVLLTALWATDVLRREVPDSLNTGLVLSGLLLAASGVGLVPLLDAAIAASAFPAGFLLVDRLSVALSGAARRMPLGDAFLLAGVGAWAGLDHGLAWLCAASTLFCASALLGRRRALPLAPFIATGLPVLVAIHTLQI